MLQAMRVQVSYRVITKAVWVFWTPHLVLVLKMNVGGASKGNPGLSGGGVVMRNPDGHLVFAAAYFLGMG